MPHLLHQLIEGLKLNDMLQEKIIINRTTSNPNYRPTYDHVLILDQNCKLLYINLVAASMLSSRPENLVGKTPKEVGIPIDEVNRFNAILQQAILTGETINTVRSFPDGPRFMEESVTPIYDSQGQFAAIYVLSTDISRQIKTEQEKQSQLLMFAQLIEKAPIGIWIVDAEGTILYSNSRLIEMFPNLPAIGSPYSSVEFPPNYGDLITPAILCGQERFGIHKKVGTQDFLVSGFALKDSSGNITMGVIAVQNISELMALQRELRKLDSLHQIGEMAASIGHEVRNPLTTVRGYLQLFQRNSDLQLFEDRFGLMISELDRATAIISEFLALSKSKSVQLKPTNLNILIAEILPLLQSHALLLGKQLTIDLVPVPDLLLDESQIKQYLLNLIQNSFEAIGADGIVNINTSIKRGRVLLAVKDNGSGITPELYEKLGTPFLTTKPLGTGLGLAVCYRIAERHNAKIDILTGSTGTTITLCFPVG